MITIQRDAEIDEAQSHDRRQKIGLPVGWKLINDLAASDWPM